MTNPAGQNATMGTGGDIFLYMQNGAHFNNAGNLHPPPTAVRSVKTVAAVTASLFNNSGNFTLNLGPSGQLSSPLAFPSPTPATSLFRAATSASSPATAARPPGPTMSPPTPHLLLAARLTSSRPPALAATAPSTSVVETPPLQAPTTSPATAHSAAAMSPSPTPLPASAPPALLSGNVNFGAQQPHPRGSTSISGGTISGTGSLTVNGLLTWSGGHRQHIAALSHQWRHQLLRRWKPPSLIGRPP